MEQLVEKGLVRAIGLSNFSITKTENPVADPGGGIGGQFPPSRSKIIKIHGIIIGSHTCNATFDTTSGLALQKLSLACI